MGVASTPGRRVQVFVGESDHAGHRPRYLALLDYLRGEGAAGATVTRGVAGFGVHSRIHTASILDLSSDLPMVLTWIDTPDEIERLLPGLLDLAGSGIVTLDDVSVVGAAGQHLHAGRRADASPAMTPDAGPSSDPGPTTEHS